MIEFADGPAAGQKLMLRRAPFFLRLTRKATAGALVAEPCTYKIEYAWDGLDQPDDKPERDEELFCYAQTKFHGNCHMLIRGENKRASGFYPMATYHFVEYQPSDTEMRYNEFWAKWCEDNAPPHLK